MSVPSLSALNLDTLSRERSHHSGTDDAEYHSSKRGDDRRGGGRRGGSGGKSSDMNTTTYDKVMSNATIRNDLTNGAILWAFPQQPVMSRQKDSPWETYFRKATMINQSNQRSDNRGTFNEFKRVETATSPAATTYFNLIRHEIPREYGIRKARDDTPWKVNIESLLDEIMLTLEAARLGIGPAVYGVALIDSDATYMVQAGENMIDAVNSLSTEWYENQDDEPVKQKQLTECAQIGENYLATMQLAAEHGMIVTDIKYDNTILIDGTIVKFIDFDPLFCTILQDVSKECVFVINAVLGLGQQMRTARQYVEYPHMMSCIFSLMRPTMVVLNQMLPNVKKEKSGLCHILGRIPLKEMTKTFLLTPRLVHARDYTEIAERILERVEKYSKWLGIISYDGPRAPKHAVRDDAPAFWTFSDLLNEEWRSSGNGN